MKKSEILKAAKTGQPVAFGKRDGYGTLRKVRVLGEEKEPIRTYGGRLANEREWPLRWKVQQVEDVQGYNDSLTYEAGDTAFAKSQELLGDWDTVEAEREAQLKRQQEKSKREADALQQQRDATDKIRDLFAAVGSPVRLDVWRGTIHIRPTDLYDFLERLGKTTARTLAADAREHFAPSLAVEDDIDYQRGYTAAIDYIEESAK